MGFINDVILRLGLDPENTVGGEKITLFESSGLLVEGHRGIYSYKPEEIAVKTKKGKLIVGGQKLKIIEINPTEIFINGKIDGIRRE
jgi:YabP family.